MAMNDRGQILIIFALAVATLLATISVLHAQNILAGMESSRTLMVFPKDEIRNLRVIAERDIMRIFEQSGSDIGEFYRKTGNVSDQIKMLYSQKGTYADIIAFLASGECFNVKIVYISGEIKFEEQLYCCKGRGCV